MNDLSTNICPHLGRKDDPTTPAGYPSTWNVCYHSLKCGIPSLKFQRSTCLGGRYKQCQVFCSDEEIRMPRSIRYRSKEVFNISKKIRLIGLILLTIIGIGAMFIFRQQWAAKINKILLPSWQRTQQVFTSHPTQTILYTQTANRVLTETKISTKIPTSTPEQTVTVTEVMDTIILALDTPIGGDIQFIIHRAIAGESLFQYAREYNTNVDTINAVNYNLPPVLYSNWIIVIPINIGDPTGLPSFETFQVTMRGLTVDFLAEELAVEPEDLSIYNNVPMDYKFSPGEWILVPRE